MPPLTSPRAGGFEKKVSVYFWTAPKILTMGACVALLGGAFFIHRWLKSKEHKLQQVGDTLASEGGRR
jgi:hypothetical protein